MFRKFSSILFLAILLLHVAGFTLLTIWNSWESQNNIELNQQIVLKGDSLIHKYPISLPYSQNFQKNNPEGQTAIFDGKFYQMSKVEYQSDTLLTYYVQANYTRENVLAIAKEFSDSVTKDLSAQKEDSSQKALEFFKKLSKDYLTGNTVLKTWFWIDIQIQTHSFISENYQVPVLMVSFHPPIS